MKPGNAGGAKAPCSDANVQSGTSPGTGASLIAPLDSVRTLQSTLQAKAKSEATARFYSLWDKVCREDVLLEAYRKCRANRGAPGVDGESFDAIEAAGLASWLQRLRQELCTKQYRCGPLLRVWIPKATGGRRPLGTARLLDLGAMAGHSKWAGIKHKKAIVDARRGKLFTKLARAITVAA